MLKDIHVGMLVEEGFEDLEFWAVYMRIAEERARISIIGREKGKVYRSKSGGLTAVADYGSDDLESFHFGALLVPGGWAPDKLRRDRNILDLICRLDDKQIPLGFICHAGWVAASAGIVRGRKATGSLGIKDDMINAGAEWIDEPALVDGNHIWGRIVEDIPEYNRVLVETIHRLGKPAPAFFGS